MPKIREQTDPEMEYVRNLPEEIRVGMAEVYNLRENIKDLKFKDPKLKEMRKNVLYELLRMHNWLYETPRRIAKEREKVRKSEQKKRDKHAAKYGSGTTQIIAYCDNSQCSHYWKKGLQWKELPIKKQGLIPNIKCRACKKTMKKIYLGALICGYTKTKKAVCVG